MAKFREKPYVIIEAVKFTEHNHLEVTDFIDIVGGISFGYDYALLGTSSGNAKVNKGDYIVKGMNGEFYHINPDIFEKTYEKIEG
jgi:hypothetical protein